MLYFDASACCVSPSYCWLNNMSEAVCGSSILLKKNMPLRVISCDFGIVEFVWFMSILSVDNFCVLSAGQEFLAK
uniref:Uncharacterized protein n=1 Tax=Rhizophora mucronata TaxID=61149 RepID=A0A2P2Q500_RHIMU